MSDPVTAAKTAREMLAQALAALQSDPAVPPHPQLLAVAEPVSKAMSALFQLERSGGASIASGGPAALEAVRSALALLQQQPSEHPQVQMALGAVAGSLSIVHGLASGARAPAGAAPSPAGSPPSIRGGQGAPHAAGQQQPQLAPRPGVGGPPVSASQPQPPSSAANTQHAGRKGGAHATPSSYEGARPPLAPMPPKAPANAPPIAVPHVPATPHPVSAPYAAAPMNPMTAPHVPATPHPMTAPHVPATPHPMTAPHVPATPRPVSAPHAAAPMNPMTAPHVPATPNPMTAPHVPATPHPASAAQSRTACHAPAEGIAPPPSLDDGRPQPPPPLGAERIDPSKAVRIDAALGVHSNSNFYRGLSGTDVIEHGGVFVSTYRVPALGTPVALRISLPGGYEFDALGVVRWTREPRDGVEPGFGAQLLQLTPEARQLVYRYVRNREPLFHDDL